MANKVAARCFSSNVTRTLLTRRFASSIQTNLFRSFSNSRRYPIGVSRRSLGAEARPNWTIQSAPSSRFVTLITVAVGLALGLWQWHGPPPYAEEPAHDEHGELETFTLAEIRKHDRKAETQWVYRADLVYDITDWIPSHPGGDVILNATGGSIDPYWDIFTIHQKQEVHDILEQYLIGRVDPNDLVDGRAPQGKIDDPFRSDPMRDEALIVHTSKPFNAETPPEDLNKFKTPTNRFYVRSHLWVPEIKDVKAFRFTVELPDGTEVEYSVDDLKKKFRQHTITATLQCSGNRRVHMSEGSKSTSGIQWDIGAISNAEWSGVKLRDVLMDAGFDVNNIPPDTRHAQFLGCEAYGASIPIEKACDAREDTIIAHSLNGEDIPRDHGYPLRIISPGTVAARSVKWVKRITLSDEEATAQWQRRDYKCFGPNVEKDPDWDSAPAIQETPVQSAITSISQKNSDHSDTCRPTHSKDDNGSVFVVEGYAFSGGGRKISRVDLSTDGGKSWIQTELLPQEYKGSKAWSWQLWRADVPASVVVGMICVKAVDEAYNTQPETFAPFYNFRGNLANAWHRVDPRKNEGQRNGRPDL